MIQYIIRRLFAAIPVLLGVTIITFVLSQLLPGDPARMVAGQFASAEQITAVRERLGLDRPVPVQYFRYLGRLLRGDLGISFSSQQAVTEELRIFFPATIELTLVAMILTVVIGLPLGIMTGSRKAPFVNSGVLFLSLVGVGLPVFWAGLVFQLIFAGRLDILPLDGRLDAMIIPPPSVTNMYTIDALLAGQWSTFVDALRHLVLPAVTLAIGRIASVARITHASMLDVMRRDYVRTAQAKGLPQRRVVNKHALKNALLPVVTTIGLQVGFLLGGTILVENIFSWGGLGTYAWIGIFRLDIPAIMGVTLVATVTFMLVNLITDIGYAFLDARITYS
jgi:peptide/nickel transport system permease protein